MQKHLPYALESESKGECEEEPCFQGTRNTVGTQGLQTKNKKQKGSVCAVI